LPPNLRAVGVAWFRKADWPALLEIFEDGAVFDSFEQWEERATEVEREFQRKGYDARILIRASLSDGACVTGVGADRERRADFAAEVADQKYGGNQS